jgi:hypothetical protein
MFLTDWLSHTGALSAFLHWLLHQNVMPLPCWNRQETGRAVCADIMENIGGRDSSCGIVTSLWVGFDSRYRQETFLSSTGFRLALGQTKPLSVPGTISRGQSGRDVKLITHLYLAPRLRMRPFSPYAVMTWILIKRGDGFVFIMENTYSNSIKPLFTPLTGWTGIQPAGQKQAAMLRDY